MTMNDNLQIPLNNSNSSTVFVDILYQKILLAFLLYSLSIFTVFGNLLVFYAIRTEKRLRAVSNLFILSLAFADLVVGIFVMPLSAANIIIGQWPFSFILCQIWLSTDYVASTASIFNLVLLSLDRYWAVVHPLLYLQNRTCKRAISFIITVWLLSLLWAPAIVFWPHIAPAHSDIIKPTECDTSFRSNKAFKTLTALVNFYIPLLTIIIISCRIMIAVHSRSTMEFGRRISSTTQKQMKQDRTFNNSSLMHHDNQRKNSSDTTSHQVNEQPVSISIVVNPFDSLLTNKNIPSFQFDDSSDLSTEINHQHNDYNKNFWQLESKKNHAIDKTRFRLSNLKSLKILFPSLTSIRNHDKRQSEDLPRNSSQNKTIKNSSSVSKNMKYVDRQSNLISVGLSQLGRTLSTTSSMSGDCQNTVTFNPMEEDISIPIETIHIQNTTITSLSSPSHTEIRTIISNNHHLDISETPVNNSNTFNILTFFDYIINPSLSSSLQKELKAARQLGLLVGVFTITWLPYFILFLVVAWCHTCISDNVYTAAIWLGYLNSTFNPLIYPLCNTHFRHAFKKILFCKHAKTKIPNRHALSELHALHSIRRHR